MSTEVNNLPPRTGSTGTQPVSGGGAGPGGGFRQNVAGDIRRYVLFSEGLLAILVWWALAETILSFWNIFQIHTIEFLGFHAAYVIAFAVVAPSFVYLLRNQAAQDFANEVLIELKKVTWPSWKETRQATVVVLVLVAIIAAILGGFDLIWAKLIKFILSRGTAS